MVKDVEDLKLELPLDSFGDGKVLDERKIGVIVARACKGVTANIADRTERRTSEWSGCGAVGRKRGYRREVLPGVGYRIERAHRHTRCRPCPVGTAVAGYARRAEVVVEVLVGAALTIGRSERSPALPCCRATEVPSADCIVDQVIDV